MKCTVCNREFKEYPACPCCYASKVLETNSPVEDSNFELKEDMRIVKETLYLLMEVIMTKKGIKNIKKKTKI